MNQHVAKKEAEVREQMAKWKGGTAKIWSYLVSHQILVIRVVSETLPGNLHITCIGTEHVTGPVSWLGSNFQLAQATTGANGYRLSVVKDESAGFTVCCGSVEVEENVPPVFGRRSG